MLRIILHIWGVKFRIVNKMLGIDIDHRLRKFSAATFNFIVNAKDLT